MRALRTLTSMFGPQTQPRPQRGTWRHWDAASTRFEGVAGAGCGRYSNKLETKYPIVSVTGSAKRADTITTFHVLQKFFLRGPSGKKMVREGSTLFAPSLGVATFLCASSTTVAAAGRDAKGVLTRPIGVLTRADAIGVLMRPDDTGALGLPVRGLLLGNIN